MAADRWEQLYPDGPPQPNSPPAQPSTGLNQMPTTRVELTISCRGLRDLDIATKSDPQCFVYLKDSYQAKFFEVGRTEQIRDSLNPDFVKKVQLNFNFEVVQRIRFEIWDIDPVGKDFLGQMETTLADIIACKGRQFIKPLIGKNRNLNCGQIIIVVEEVVANKQVLTFTPSCAGIRRSLFSKRSTFLQIWKSNEDGTVSVVHKTEVCPGSTDPSFKTVSLKISSLCGGDFDRSIRFDLMKYSLSGDHRLMGSATTTVNTMLRGTGDENQIELQKGSSDKKRGTLHLKNISLKEEVTFVDFIRGGTELHFAVAIDFTASNGVPTDPRSLHFINPQKPNPYEIALKSVGDIISHYDPKEMYASFGFGAILPPAQTVSHHFPLNGNPHHPYCNGVEDLINCYRNILKQVILYGPTNFSPVIEATAEIARRNEDGNNYFILLVITDGIICDMDQTKKSIVKASLLPLSIIIVGVGSADFSAMNDLDSDDAILSAGGKKASRDIVQFVPLNRFLTRDGNYVHSMVELAREVLFEVPGQVLSYMNLKGFKPKKPSLTGPSAPTFNYNFT